MNDNTSCCVCLKVGSVENNQIIGCRSSNCKTIVHKACFGLQKIPIEVWFCPKCEAPDNKTDVRCELCPSRDGALVHTDNGGWCHIVCALFIPGVEFLNVDKFESVSLEKISSDKLYKVCSICEKDNRLDCASTGACIQCKKSACKVMFHVTCGQSHGLLKESISLKDGIQYVAYCSLHQQKSKRRNFILRLQQDENVPQNRLAQSKENQNYCIASQETSAESFPVGNRSSSESNKPKDVNITSKDKQINSVYYSKTSICEAFINEELKSSNTLIGEHSRSHKHILPEKPHGANISQSIIKKECSVGSDYLPSCSLPSNTCLHSSDKSLTTVCKSQLPAKTPFIATKKRKLLSAEQKLSTNEKFKKTKTVSDEVKNEIEKRVSRKRVAPSLPKSIGNHVNNTIGRSAALTNPITVSSPNTSKIGGVNDQSLEELLEWQWDQTGALLMLQAEASDIASLLSCLHDLKNENEQLLSKQLKLSQRRDQLQSINTRLQLQLIPKPNEMITKSETTMYNESRPTIIQSTLRPIQKAPEISHKQVSLANSANVRCCLITDSNSAFLQQSIPMFNQASSSPQSQQTLALLTNYQQQHKEGQSLPAGVSVSNLYSRTDLVSLLNTQFCSQLNGYAQPTTIVTNNQQKSFIHDLLISPNNNGSNMEIVYHSLQQKCQPNSMSTSNGNHFNYTPINRNIDKPSK